MKTKQSWVVLALLTICVTAGVWLAVKMADTTPETVPERR